MHGQTNRQKFELFFLCHILLRPNKKNMCGSGHTSKNIRVLGRIYYSIFFSKLFSLEYSDVLGNAFNKKKLIFKKKDIFEHI